MIVCLCGSFRFYDEILRVKETLAESRLDCLIPVPFRFRKKSQPSEFVQEWDSLSPEEKMRRSRQAEMAYLRKIDQADAVFLVNPGGYIGPSVTFEIGYAFGKGKPIFASEPLADFTLMSLIEGVLRPEDLRSRL